MSSSRILDIVIFVWTFCPHNVGFNRPHTHTHTQRYQSITYHFVMSPTRKPCKATYCPSYSSSLTQQKSSDPSFL